MPSASFVEVRTTGAGSGTVSSSTDDDTLSTYGVSLVPASALDASAVFNIAASSPSLGTATPAFSGALTITSRLPSGYHSFASRLISSSVISPTKRANSVYSSSIDGSVSPTRKLRTYSSALANDWML